MDLIHSPERDIIPISVNFFFKEFYEWADSIANQTIGQYGGPVRSL